jgi:hypothetical protein
MDDHKRWTLSVEDNHLLMVGHRLASPARDAYFVGLDRCYRYLLQGSEDRNAVVSRTL